MRSGAAAPKKTTYIYFERLTFLKVVAEHAPTSTNIENEDSGSPSNQEIQNVQQYRPHQKKQRMTEDTVGMQMVDVLKSSISAREEREKNDDSDKLFLLSLVDGFKRIPDTFKASAKIDMIKLIEKYQAQNINRFDYSTNTQWHYDCAGTSSRQGYFTGPPSGASGYNLQSPESELSQSSDYVDTF